MSEPTTPHAPDPRDSPVNGLLVLGYLIISAGVIAGVALAVRTLPDGCDQYPGDPCAHPNLTVGLILLFGSFFAAILLGIVGITARRVVAALPAPTHDPQQRQLPLGNSQL